MQQRVCVYYVASGCHGVVAVLLASRREALELPPLNGRGQGWAITAVVKPKTWPARSLLHDRRWVCGETRCWDGQRTTLAVVRLTPRAGELPRCNNRSMFPCVPDGLPRPAPPSSMEYNPQPLSALNSGPGNHPRAGFDITPSADHHHPRSIHAPGGPTPIPDVIANYFAPPSAATLQDSLGGNLVIVARYLQKKTLPHHARAFASPSYLPES